MSPTPLDDVKDPDCIAEEMGLTVQAQLPVFGREKDGWMDGWIM